MRTKTDQIKIFVIWFTVNQYQIRLDMAVSVIRPVARKRMVEVTAG